MIVPSASCVTMLPPQESANSSSFRPEFNRRGNPNTSLIPSSGKLSRAGRYFA